MTNVPCWRKGVRTLQCDWIYLVKEPAGKHAFAVMTHANLQQRTDVFCLNLEENNVHVFHVLLARKPNKSEFSVLKITRVESSKATISTHHKTASLDNPANFNFHF